MNCRKCNKKLSQDEEQNRICFECLYDAKDNLPNIIDA